MDATLTELPEAWGRGQCRRAPGCRWAALGALL